MPSEASIASNTISAVPMIGYNRKSIEIMSDQSIVLGNNRLIENMHA